MVFEPAFIQVTPGDHIRFLASDKGHNAGVNEGMLPDGAAGCKGKINEE
jgi:plastocyanin